MEGREERWRSQQSRLMKEICGGVEERKLFDRERCVHRIPWKEQGDASVSPQIRVTNRGRVQPPLFVGNNCFARRSGGNVVPSIRIYIYPSFVSFSPLPLVCITSAPSVRVVLPFLSLSLFLIARPSVRNSLSRKKFLTFPSRRF